MVRARSIVQPVLHELKSGQREVVEGDVIGRAGGANRVDFHRHRLERSKPRVEDRRDGGVALIIDAADLAAAVVEIEVRRELGVLGRGMKRRRVDEPEVLLHVGT